MTAGGMSSRMGEPLRGSEVFLLPTGGLATPGYSWMTPPGSMKLSFPHDRVIPVTVRCRSYRGVRNAGYRRFQIE